MSSPTVEGILQFTDERQDGQLRDPSQPLRPARGNHLVPRQIIRELQLRPACSSAASPAAACSTASKPSKAARPMNTCEKIALYDATALDPAADASSSSTTPTSSPRA